ncbi:MAG: hypothetical protein RLP14_00545 [Owenweeksia sp.]
MKQKPEHSDIDQKLNWLQSRNCKLLEETDDLLDHNRKILNALVKATET